MNNARFDELASKFYGAEISENEKQELEKDLLNNPEKKQQFDKIGAYYNNLKDPATVFNPDTPKALLAFKARIMKISSKKILQWSYSAAASIILLFAVYQYWNFNLKSINVSCTDNLTYTLPDGSIVTLNAGSSISFPAHFKKRNINLKGEAYFQVTKNNIPFIVQSGHTKTTVLGTKFNIDARSPNQVTLTVKEGMVRFENSTANKHVTLTKNQQAKSILLKNEIDVNEINNSNYLAWKSKQLVFKNSPLADVISEAQNLFCVKINITDTDLYGFRVTGTFSITNAKDFLDELKFIIPIKAKTENNEINIYHQ